MARNKIETGVATGRPGQDYVCKTLRGHKGQITDAVFVTSNDVYNEEIIERMSIRLLQAAVKTSLYVYGMCEKEEVCGRSNLMNHRLPV